MPLLREGLDAADQVRPADLPPVVVAEPGAGTPVPSREQWDADVVALGQAQGARVPSYDDVREFVADHPSWGLLAFLIRGVEVQLCPLTAMDGSTDPEQALRAVLTDHLDELSTEQVADDAWTAHALGIHGTGAVIIQDAVALRRDGALVVVVSVAHSVLVAGVMSELLPMLAEG